MTLPLSQFDLVECKIPPSLSQILIKSSSPDIFTPRQNCYAKTLHCPPYGLYSIFIQPALPPPFHAERLIAFKDLCLVGLLLIFMEREARPSFMDLKVG